MAEEDVFMGLSMEDMKETLMIGLSMAILSFTFAFMRKMVMNYLED